MEPRVSSEAMSRWFVYIIQCSDGSFYTGMTKDVKRRLDEHNNSHHLGARYTRTRRPMTLVYQEKLATRAKAVQREIKIKRLGRKGKEVLINKHGG